MSKNKKISIVLIVTIVLAILSGVGVYNLVIPDRETIYVFNDDYKAGTKITSSMFTPVQVDASIVNAGKKTDISKRLVSTATFKALASANETLKIDVSEGLPFTASMISSIGGNSIQVNMNPTSIAITVPINNISGVTPDLTDNCYVNVYVSVNGETKLDPDLEKMKVLSVYSSKGELTGVSLECNQTQATKLVNYNNYGSIQLGLVDSEGYQYSN